MTNQTPPDRLPESPRPAVPTGVVPSRLTSDQGTLLQPWTPSDESKLQEAQATLAGLQTRRQMARQTAVDKLQRRLSLDPEMGYIIDRIIDNAAGVREALAPFDSGARPGEVA